MEDILNEVNGVSFLFNRVHRLNGEVRILKHSTFQFYHFLAQILQNLLVILRRVSGFFVLFWLLSPDSGWSVVETRRRLVAYSIGW